MNIKLEKVILILLLLTMGTMIVRGQSSQFSYAQYMDNLIPLNQAYSLFDKTGSVSLVADKQFVGIQGAPSSYFFNGNLPLPDINGSAGLSVINDQIAVEHQTQVNAFFAKSIQLSNNSFLGVSLNAGIRNYIGDYSTLDPNDPTFRNDVRQTKPNFGFGVLYYSDWYYFGISVPELTLNSLGSASVQQSYNFKNHYYLSGAMLTYLTSDISFKPATLVVYARGIPVTANISGTFYFKNQFGLGMNYRTDNKAAARLSIDINSIHIGYSYQFGTSSNNLGSFNSATNEVMVSYRFGKDPDPKVL